MSRETVTRIETADTKKTYEFPGEGIPQLWELSLTIACIDSEDGSTKTRSTNVAVVHVERQTLVNAGIMPAGKSDKKPTEETKETAEDLCLRLLEHLGVYPAE